MVNKSCAKIFPNIHNSQMQGFKIFTKNKVVIGCQKTIQCLFGDQGFKPCYEKLYMDHMLIAL
jgi:hypothetical protein